MKFPFSNRLPKPNPEEEEKRMEEMKDVKISSSEKLTMLWTAFICIFLPCVGILLAIVLVSMLIFGLL